MKRKNEMKIKNVIFENKQYFETIEKIHNSDKLPVLDAYRVNRLVKKLNELNEEYSELKKKILIQYGTRDENSKTESYTISAENRDAFAKEYADLVNIEHDLEMEMLTFPSKLEDGISGADLNLLELFFDLSGLEPEEKGEESVDPPLSPMLKQMKGEIDELESSTEEEDVISA